MSVFLFRHHYFSNLFNLFSKYTSDRLQNDSDETIQTIPTIGFNVEVLQYKNIKFQVCMLLLGEGT